MPVLEAVDVHKRYPSGERTIEAVRGVSLALEAGEFVAIVGPSGCGKSTLLHICGAMDRPSAGDVRLEGRALSDLDDDRLTRVRRDRIGFVFQFFNLLPTLTVAQNIALPQLLAGRPAAQAEDEALRLAARVGLGDRTRHFPRQLSGGEAQRVAIARALVQRPAVLVADEPTGNLDSENGRRVLDLLLEVNAQFETAILLATHDNDVARAAGRVLHMSDGRLVDAAGAGQRQG
jgi:putative ABC transport system ATP-binding protein